MLASLRFPLRWGYPRTGGVQFFFEAFGLLHDGRPNGRKSPNGIAHTHIRPLAVKRGGVVGLPKHFQQFFERNFGRVVYNAGHLGMAGLAVAYFLQVGFFPFGSPTVASGYAHYAVQFLENGFHTPKTACP